MKLRLLRSLVLLALLPAAAAQAADRWDADTLDTFGRIPIQDGGRVKPLSTFAIFELVKISGRMHATTPEGERVPATYWMLDTLFHPEIAREYRVILIENPQVMQAVGLDDSDKRARFRLADLEPRAGLLLVLARAAADLEDNERSPVQNQILALWDAYASYDALVRAFDFARYREPVPAGSPLAEALAAGLSGEPGPGDTLRYSDLLAALPELVEARRTSPGGSRLLPVLDRLDSAARGSSALTVIPPADEHGHETWLSPGSLLRFVADGHHTAEEEIAAVASMERLHDAIEGGAPAGAALEDLLARTRGGAVARGEYRRIPLEIVFYKIRPFYWSLVLFVLSAVVVAASWAAPRSVWLGRAAVLSVVAPTVLLVAGITLRCIVRGRPPVTTLYETTLFIPAVAILVALVAEWINRRRIALSLAAAFGCLGLFLAHNYELRGPDTMESMVAVLNSNFWLSTHVTTVTIGYSAGLLAAALGHLYIFGQALGFGPRNPGFFRSVTRITYGVLCFGTVFAFVGTVLGGIWANYSWGRFWGWDPKENGALLIILWFLFILHGRLGGYLRDLGIAVCSVLGGMIVAFSWWGVNLLSVGLHSYGFLSGVQRILTAFWGIELAVASLGLVAWVRMRNQRAAAYAAGARGTGDAQGGPPAPRP